MLSAPLRMSLATDATCDTALDDLGLWAWVAMAKPGDHVIYHRGFLSLDLIGHGSHLTSAARRQLRDLAAAALKAAEEKRVHLVQARLGPDHFAYIAVARPKTKPKPRRSRHDHAPPIGL